MSCVAFTYVFRLSVSIREVDSVLYTHIHEFLCMSHLSYFIYFPVTHTKNQNQNKTKQVENENQKKEKIKRSRRRKEEPNVRSTWIFPGFRQLQKDKNNANNANHYVKLGKKRRTSSFQQLLHLFSKYAICWQFCVRVCVCVCVWACTGACVRVYMCLCLCIRAYMYICDLCLL